MFTKRKLIDILCISLLVSFALGISFYNLLSERFDNGNFAATFLFIVIFITATVVAYIFRDKAVILFVGGYFALLALCSVIGIVMDIGGFPHNTFTVYCALFYAPLYGFAAASKSWAYVACASSLVVCGVSALLFYKLFVGKNEK